MKYDKEYFCPHCGAILNDQPGFDPENGTWICTTCGQLLMDDETYNGDRYDGVAWFCDNCGALLNRQAGFSDSYGSWICTECGHLNGTSDEDIINGFKCPRCGATLDIQICFNKYDDDWKCTECGAHLHHLYSDDEYEEVEESKHKCPECGAVLDDQWRFSEYDDDWKCTKCGAHLHHDYSSDDYIVMKYICPICDAPLDIQSGFFEYEDNYECAVCGTKLHHDYSYGEYIVVDDEELKNNSNHSHYNSSYRHRSESASRGNSSPKTEKKKSASLGIIILLILILCVIGYFGNKYEIAQHPGEKKLSFSASSFKGKDYYDTIIKLTEEGFSDIKLFPLNDLKRGIFSRDGKKEGKIESIEINGISDFQVNTWVDEKSVVRITYHSFEKTKKNGFDNNKNNHLIINGVDITLPTYLVANTQNSVSSIFHVNGEDEAILTVHFDSRNEWIGLSNFATNYVLNQSDCLFSGMSGKETLALGKLNDKVFIIHFVTLSTEKSPEYLHIAFISPDSSKMDYTTDYEAILSNIYVPKNSEMRIDFTLNDYKGDNVNSVVDDLKAKGFKNIKIENLHDIVLGVFVKDGSVESISINNIVDYKVGDWISDQSEVVITYHGKK